MRHTFENDVCTFCKLNRTLNKVHWEDRYVMTWHVPPQMQRSELKVQHLIVPKRHVRAPWEMNGLEWKSLEKAVNQMGSSLQLPGGMFFARFGNMNLNAGTVPHLHFNVWVPNKTGEVRVPIFKDAGSREENQKRMAGFAVRYEAEKRGVSTDND